MLSQHPLAWRDTEEAEAQVQWRKGDIGLALKPVHGLQTLEKFAEMVGVEYRTLREYRQVSATYGFGARAPNPSWTHHLRVVDRPDHLEWLANLFGG